MSVSRRLARPAVRTLCCAIPVVALLAAGCSSTQHLVGESTSSVPGTDTSLAESTTTTVAVPATTAPLATVPPTVAPTAPTLPPPAGGSVLSAPTNLEYTSPGGISLPAGFTCDGVDPGIPGWSVADCQQMPSYDDGVTTLVLKRNDDGRFAVAVLFKSGTHLVQRYWAEEADAGVWSDVKVILGDFHFDDGAEVWVGYRYEGTGQYLDLDVIDPRPDGTIFVGGLHGLDHGVVHVHPGGATVQSSVYGPSDPGCCASSLLQRELTFSGEQWWASAGATYPTASAPAVTGDF